MAHSLEIPTVIPILYGIQQVVTSVGASHQISNTVSNTASTFKPSSKVVVRRAARCMRSAWRRRDARLWSAHVLAKLIPDVLRTVKRKTVAFTPRKWNYAKLLILRRKKKELRKTINTAKQ